MKSTIGVEHHGVELHLGSGSNCSVFGLFLDIADVSYHLDSSRSRHASPGFSTGLGDSDIRQQGWVWLLSGIFGGQAVCVCRETDQTAPVLQSLASSGR